MELEKYIERAKNAINGAYFDIQDALINYDRSLENLKSKAELFGDGSAFFLKG